MSEELRELWLAVFAETQYTDSPIPRAVLFLLEREKEREDAEEADYERRMMGGE